MPSKAQKLKNKELFKRLLKRSGLQNTIIIYGEVWLSKKDERPTIEIDSVE